MLTKLHLENFKAWRELSMNFGKVTVLFGENSSGKSSLIQFLLMLKQTKNAADRGLVLDFGGGPTDPVALGNYREAVHRNRKTDDLPESDLPEMGWNLTWRLPKELKVTNPLGSRGEVLYSGNELRLMTSVGPAVSGFAIAARHLTYEFDNTTFELRPRDGNGKFELASAGCQPFKFKRNVGRAWSLDGPVKTHLFPGAARNLFQNTSFLSEFESAYETLMDRIFYLGPLRHRPERDYSWSGAGREGVGYSGEHTIDAILSATARGWRDNLGPRQHRKPFQEMIAFWLKQLGLIESFSVEEVVEGSGLGLYRAFVRRSRGGPKTTLMDVGFGVSQVLPVLVLLYYVPKGSIVLMEQPEIHLHPSVQSGLADVILAAALHRDVQIVVESHSEHLLRRLLRRVAEEKQPESGQSISHSDLRLYFVHSQSGEAILKPLHLNEWGGIENWPDGFFGDEMGEVAATSSAGLRRRMQAKR